MTLPAEEEKSRFVERMFDGIAPRYDFMNRLMTFGIDRSWRHKTISALGLEPGQTVLDLGCGTGDLSQAAIDVGATVVGVDLSQEMLVRARRRMPGLRLIRGKGEALPLADQSVDAVVSGFALRNFESIPAVLRECARVLREDGRIAILEVDVPEGALVKSGFDVYFQRVVPLLGRIVSKGYAYDYLSHSLVYLPSREELFFMLREAGFERIEKNRLTAGAAQLVVAHKRSEEG